jgi:hypothetical protein
MEMAEYGKRALSVQVGRGRSTLYFKCIESGVKIRQEGVVGQFESHREKALPQSAPCKQAPTHSRNQEEDGSCENLFNVPVLPRNRQPVLEAIKNRAVDTHEEAYGRKRAQEAIRR